MSSWQPNVSNRVIVYACSRRQQSQQSQRPRRRGAVSMSPCPTARCCGGNTMWRESPGVTIKRVSQTVPEGAASNAEALVHACACEGAWDTV